MFSPLLSHIVLSDASSTSLMAELYVLISYPFDLFEMFFFLINVKWTYKLALFQEKCTAEVNKDWPEYTGSWMYGNSSNKMQLTSPRLWQE